MNSTPRLVPPLPPAPVSQTPKPLRVLLVEDQPTDGLLLIHTLEQAGFEPSWTRVETESEYLAHLDPALDIILADYALPQFSGLEALRLLQEHGLRIPFILITGTAGEEAAVSALHLGADDYLLKDRLARLGRAVMRALEQHALSEAKQRSEHDLRVSELRLLTHEREARAAAEAAVRLRDEFVAIASHELRTPVTAIKCTAQLMLRSLDRGDLAPAQIISGLSMVDTMTERLNLIIMDLLDVSRLRTGQLELHSETIDVRHLVEEVVNQQRVQAGSRYPLVSNVLGPLPALLADSHRIQQVLTNVIENAIKYSPEGGPIEVCMRAEGTGLLLTVADHGIGLPADAAETIFEPFGRASNAQTGHLPGMGLGLYISRQIVEQHGGRMWADSAGEGKGTLVSVWLPGEMRPTIQARPSRVLVVDDESAIRDAIGDALELEGYDCRRAANGQVALDVLTEWPADIIVLDLMMPVMDGWTFRRAQLAREEFREIPVVIVSASPPNANRDRDLGPAATISKPFELDALFVAIHDHVLNEPPVRTAA